MEQHRRQDTGSQGAGELIRLTRFGLWFGGGLVLAAALLIGVDVTLRKFFDTSIGGADELAGYALLAFFGLIAWHGWNVAQQSWVSGSRSQSALQTPTVLPQSIWLLGLAIFFLVGLVLLCQAINRIARGDAAAAEKLISTRSAEEEVRQEIEEQWSGPRSRS